MVVWKSWVWPTKKTGLSVSVLVYLGAPVSTSIKSVQVRSTTATSRTCTNPPSGRQIPLYNTVKWHLKLLILVSCLYVPVYWTHMVSSDQRILSVTVLVSFRGFFQTTGMWRGASVWTLHHETQCCSNGWPSGTFYIHTRSSGASHEWHLSSWSCLLPRTFFSSYCSVQADGQLWDLAFPRSLSW